MTDDKKPEDAPISDEKIFKSVKYYCIGNIDEKIEKTLNERGAKKDSYLSQMVTHVIADDDSNDEYSEAKELFELPVVTSRWVELSSKCNTLLPLNAFNPESKQLFSGVVGCPSQLSKEDSCIVWALITFHGGCCQLDLDKKVTHLITTRPQGAKYECAVSHDSITIVTPDWIIDSVNNSKMEDHLKYHPKLLILTPPKEPTPSPPPKPPTPVPVTPTVPRTPTEQPHTPNIPAVSQTTPQTTPTMQPGTPRMITPGQTRHPQHRPRYPPPGIEQMIRGQSPRAQMNHPRFPQMDQSMPRMMGMPPRPDNVAAREALARMVNSRIQHTGQVVPETPEGPVTMNMLQRHPIPLPQQVMAGARDGSPQRFPPHMPPNLPSPSSQQQRMMMMSNQPRHQQFHPANMQQHQQQQQQHQQQLLQHQQQHQQQQRPPMFMQHNFFPGGMPPRSMPPMTMTMPQRAPTPPRGMAQVPTSSTATGGKVSPRGPGAVNSPVRSNTPTGSAKSSKNNSRSNTPTGGNRTLRNITNGTEEAFPPNKQTNKIQQIMSSITRSPRSTNRPNQFQSKMTDEPRYYGHDEVDRVPGDLCLLGCIFYITDYPKCLSKEELETWQLVIEQHGGIVDPSYSNRVTHILCEHQKSDVYQMAIRDNKRVVTALWLNDVLHQKKMVPPWQALHFPSLYTDFKPGKDQMISISGYEHEERSKVKQMIQLIGAKYTGYMTRANTVLLCKKPEGVKFQKANEWRIPVVNTQWLSDIVTGALGALKAKIPPKYQVFNLGEDEFKADPVQVQPWLNGWRVPVKVPKESWKKFTPSTVKNNAAAEMENNKRKSPTEASNLSPEPKKARMVAEIELDSITPSAFLSPKVLFTGIPTSETDKYLQNIRSLGGDLASSSADCTHLVTHRVSRTVKFLTCINTCKFIVRPDWIEDSVAKGRFLDEDRYTIDEKTSDSQFSCNVRESLKRSSVKKLFENFTFYLTPGVQPSWSMMKEIIESAGGRIVKKKPQPRTVANGKNEKGEQLYIVISTDNDIHLCKEYFSKKLGVHNAEFALSGILRQEVDYGLYRMENR